MTLENVVERQVTSHTLVVVDGKIERFPLDTQLQVNRVAKAGGVIFEDWETAKKVAFGLTDKMGTTLLKPVSFRGPLFVPSDIPEWATMLAADEVQFFNQEDML
jgi:hypothetical protein